MAVRSCRACGLGLRDGARFCDGCGASVSAGREQAEYKQVTVLFADVVGSMQLAAALGPEALRDVVTQVFSRSAVAVERYGGTVDKFTGDGIMAVFGAPAALEDHALRACLAALNIQGEIQKLAGEIRRRDDGIAVQVRVGLNSGQVVAGEIGSGAAGYTAIGEQVGMAQRMESVAPPGGVMLSESTARLVENVALLGDLEMVRIKGSKAAVPARRLLAVSADRIAPQRREPTLVGRTWELNTIAGILDQSIDGNGCVVGVVGPAGIGKSRAVGEAVQLAIGRGLDVFSTYCESHTRDVPFHVVGRLLQAVFGISDVAAQVARARVRTRIPDASPEDLLLLDDLLRIADPAVALPAITPDARRRRLGAMLNAAALARTTPALFVVEDAHWIDEASETMLAEFATVVPQTRSLVLITYRPEYRGTLSHTSGAQTIALGPLNTSQTLALIRELLGSHPSVTGLAQQIAEQAAGNPFFAEEIVRDLAGRGVLYGEQGHYECRDDSVAISLPGTLQATIAARIDRLAAAAKQALYAGAVIGARFRPDVLAIVLGDNGSPDEALTELMAVELIDQVRFTPHAEFAFRHPLIPTVAYESQLKAGRAELHRRVADVIQQGDSGSDENAALIAEHLEAADDPHAAFDWHMRAAAWSNFRDRAAARASWARARQVADRLAAEDPDRLRMQIEPRTLLCATAFLANVGFDDVGFDELHELCATAGDKVSLAIGMSGAILAMATNGRPRDAADLCPEFTELVDAIGDPALTVGLFQAALYAYSEAGEVVEAVRLGQRVIDLADGDPTMGNLILGSPLSMTLGITGLAKMRLGIAGWKEDADAAVAMASRFDATSHVSAIMWKYVGAIPFGVLVADGTAVAETSFALRIAEQAGDDFLLGLAQLTHGLTLIQRGGLERDEGLSLLRRVRESAERGRFVRVAIPIVDPYLARELARTGEIDKAIDLARSVFDDDFETGEMFWVWLAATVLVESLLARRGDRDLADAQIAMDRLAASSPGPEYLHHELTVLRLRGLLAQAQGDAFAHQQFMESFRAKAAAAGFEPLASRQG
ncbi:ATP-binding protein [Mycobacterium conspicuum]|uniref:Cyclase n=2 Tax=Mycobacterium conspicuum TaxID=44010 RepID=A0A1X1SW40_9MYCO|nr:adenylate/guanylate cyclase domain-containing protein [Mycobacterium conspicuum]ORV35148.1 cyclase [Mycobacterium conspicuum]BBZ42095.1 cyclase [Mycobacterium conspicuum]